MTASELPAEEIQSAVAILEAGGLVAFPTETVYGLGADADNQQALARIFQVKGRPATHPLIVHIRGLDALHDWAVNIPEAALRLGRAFWPGPLTMVLRRSERVIDAVTGGQDTVALRVPAHPVALQLLDAFGRGVAAPSANRFGRISPTRAEHVREDLGQDVDLVLDGGPCEVGIESTIVDLSRGPPIILRPGRIGIEDIERVLEQAPQAQEAPDAAAPRTPGSHEAHYAPRAALKLFTRRELTDELARHRGQRIAVLALEASVPRVPAMVTRVLPASATLYARDLYAKLRELDSLGPDLILVETPPSSEPWAAVRDRLRRASHAHAVAGTRAERHSHPWMVGAKKSQEPATGDSDGAGH